MNEYSGEMGHVVDCTAPAIIVDYRRDCLFIQLLPIRVRRCMFTGTYVRTPIVNMASLKTYLLASYLPLHSVSLHSLRRLRAARSV